MSARDTWRPAPPDEGDVERLSAEYDAVNAALASFDGDPAALGNLLDESDECLDLALMAIALEAT